MKLGGYGGLTVAYLGLDLGGHQGWTNEGPKAPSRGGLRRGSRRGSRREAQRGEGSGKGAVAPSPVMGVRGCHPRKFFKKNTLKCAFWGLLESENGSSKIAHFI
jgi:hypothetical protein